MAYFCMATGLTPDVYWGLTQIEIEAFIEAVKAQNKGR